MQPQRNALADFTLPQMDLVGPTVDDDIRRAIQRYGADAVRAAIKNATKAKRGRPLEGDWRELRDVIHADALEWLAGGDPIADRSNYAIANKFAERNPGHSVVSTQKRVLRKLSRKPYDRHWFILITAETLSRDGFPYAAHLRALEALAMLPDSKTAELWQSMLEIARSTVADYEAREGAPPHPSMSFGQIEEAVRNSSVVAMLRPARRGGIFGLASPSSQSSGGDLGAMLFRADKEE